RLFADERHQGHEPRPLDRHGHGVLAGGGATAFAAADNFAVAVGQLLQELDVLVVDIQRARAFAVDENRILLLRADLAFGLATVRGVGICRTWRATKGHSLLPEYGK